MTVLLGYPPPTGLVTELISCYKFWHSFLPNISRTCRYTLAARIDSLFLDTIELVFIASYLSKPQKRPFVQKAVGKFDLLKLFLQIAWENKILDNEKYAALGHKLYEIGKHIGGWNKSLAE